ncbi:hypothetical protein [Saccharomonospora xinjiangensis]|uniref:hypothetical protein n=1 Tax=Saccharomonospora xinjiangensis TaxID=75294 RepID=UPI003510C84B
MKDRDRAARGRHRAPTTPRSWVRPTALGSLVAGLLALTVYATSGLVRSGDTAAAALALSGDPVSTSRATAKTASTTTSATPPSTTSTTTTTSEPPETTEPEPTEPPEPETTEEPPPEPVTPEPQACSTDLEGTEPHVAQVGHHVLTQFAVDSVGGRASRANASNHPAGLALDFMVSPEVGDALAEYVVAHQAEFGVTYVIWEQRINSGSGWSVMEDRGSPTANHMDHVHVSFAAGADVSVTC